MNKEKLKKLVCKYVYQKEYKKEAEVPVDWESLKEKYLQDPGPEIQMLKNESRVRFCEQELVLVENQLNLLTETLEQLQTEYEKWYVENEVLYRHRDKRSIEGTNLLAGPDGDCIEAWVQYFYNSLCEYKQKLQISAGIAAKGDIGEENVAKALENSSLSRYVLHNIVLDVADDQGKTNEIDTYVITKYGIGVLEVKNYGKYGTTLNITDTELWDLVDKKTGRVIKQEKNPMSQNRRHARATEIVVRQMFGKEVPVFPLIVIGNNKVGLNYQSNLTVKNVDTFLPYLEKMKSNTVLSTEEMFDLYRMFEQADIGSNSFQIVSYRKQIYYMMEIFNTILPWLAYNQDAKNFYYKTRKMLAWGGGITYAVLLALIALLSGSVDNFLLGLLGMSMIISGGAVIWAVVKKCKEFLQECRKKWGF